MRAGARTSSISLPLRTTSGIYVVGFELADGKVQAVRSIVNPEKLRHLGPVGDIVGLVRPKR